MLVFRCGLMDSVRLKQLMKLELLIGVLIAEFEIQGNQVPRAR